MRRPSAKQTSSGRVPSDTRSRSRSGSKPKCADCRLEGIDHDAQTDAWCHGYCKRHARARGYSEPGRTSPARARRSPSMEGRRAVYCPDCNEEGFATPSQTAAWCQGFCERHAHKRGYQKPGRDACVDAARRARKAVGEALTELGNAGQRWRRCGEHGCKKRARAPFGTSRYCAAHSAWRLRCWAYRHRMADLKALPPLASSPLGHWLRRQQALVSMAQAGGISLLNDDQTKLLISTRLWNVTRQDAFRARQAEQRREDGERDTMSGNDVDSHGT